MRCYLNMVLVSLCGLILTAGSAAAETKTAQQCYKEDSNWTVSCGALEGPQQLRDDCFSMADRQLERCLDSVGKTSEVGPAKPSLPATRVIERAPLGGNVLDPAATAPKLYQRAPLHNLQGGGTGQ